MYSEKMTVDMGSSKSNFQSSMNADKLGMNEERCMQPISTCSQLPPAYLNQMRMNECQQEMQMQTQMQMPGSWYYEGENKLDEEIANSITNTSPTNELEMFMLAQGNRFEGTNVTNTIIVPSSEHVAEIVGRQGCKIKALRAKTNTYIKTPVRGEPPMFVVTGRLEDIIEAIKEIECAAEHFTQIRASRRHSQGGMPAPGHVTAYVRVPLRVVGLVVGPKGATIKRIQQDTHTYIITPSREKEPAFEHLQFKVTGLPDNVDSARKEIEHHIYLRTGSLPITSLSSDVDLATNGIAQVSTINLRDRPTYGSLAPARNTNLGTMDHAMFGDLTRPMHSPMNKLMYGMDEMRLQGSNLSCYPTRDAMNWYQQNGFNNSSVSNYPDFSKGLTTSNDVLFSSHKHESIAPTQRSQQSMLSTYRQNVGEGVSSSSSSGSRDEGLSDSPVSLFDGLNPHDHNIRRELEMIWNGYETGLDSLISQDFNVPTLLA
uniref:KH domain-containing protein n=1 Tax=Rhabditophanes sp. KR3021 TaxID=114890 RepID=A0AC35TMT9_9BILA